MPGMKSFFFPFAALLFLSSCCCPNTVVKSYPKSALPDPGVPGHLARVTDEVRGLWMDNGTDWFSLSGGTVNAKEFGARGDGATDDTQAIQDALNAGNLFLPPGTYMVRMISIPANRLLIGMGAGSILKLKAGSPDFSNVLSIKDASQVLIRDIAIDGSGNNVASGEHSHNLFIWNSKDVLVDNVILHDAQGDGISIGSDENGETRRITIRNCNFYNRGRGGITIVGQGASDVFLTNNHIRLGTQVTTSTSHINGIHVELSSPVATHPTENIQILDNIVREGGISISTKQTDGQWRKVRIAGNEIDLSGSEAKHGIWLLETADFTITDNIITGNKDGNQTGIRIHDTLPEANTGRGIINNNVITDLGGNDGNGIAITSDVPAVESRFLIQSNIIKNIARRGILVNTKSDNITISDNFIAETGRPGIELLNSSNFIINANQIEDATGSGITIRSVEPGDSVSTGMVNGNIISLSSDGKGISIYECENCLGSVSKIIVMGNDVSRTTGYIDIAPTAVDMSVFHNKTFLSVNPVFVNGDPTPSIRYGNVSGVFTCSNTTPTTITNFDDAVNMTEIEIYFTTGNTTIAHGNNIILSGGADLTPANGTVLQFRKRNGIWYQL